MQPGVSSRPKGPWKGLIPYAEEDYPYFFGRTRERRTIAANLKSSAITVLYGPSGVGKSSLLVAGVLHDLKEAAERNREERGRIGYLPLLCRQWQGDYEATLLAELRTRAAEFQALPTADAEDFTTLCRNWLTADHGLLLLIFDQFEEFFLYHPTPEEWTRLGSLLAELLSGRVRVLFSLREDHLSSLERLQSSLPDLFSNQLRVEHLTEKSAQEGILGPVDVWNERHAADYKLEPELVSEVIRQLQPEHVPSPAFLAAGRKTSQIQAPWLQIVMSRIWSEETAAQSKVLRLATLSKLQGVERIAETHLADEMKGLSLPERMAASSIFRRLVTPSGSKILYPESGLVQTTTRPLRKHVLPVLKKLTGGGRILEPIDTADGRRYQIYHDLLGPAIISWSSRFWRKAVVVVAASVCMVVLATTTVLVVPRYLRAQQEVQDTNIAAVALSSLALGDSLPLQVRQSLACYAWLRSDNDVLKERAGQAIKALFPIESKELAMPRILRVAISPNTRYIAVSGQSGSVWLIRRKVQDNRESEYAVRLLTGHQSPVAAVAMVSRYLATGDAAGIVRVYEPTSGKLLSHWKAHDGAINAVAINYFEDALATASQDGQIKVWKPSGELLQTLKAHSGEVYAVDFRRDLPHLASAGSDGTLRGWNYKSGSLLRTVTQPGIRDVSISVHGTRVAVGTTKGVSLVDLGTWQETQLPVTGQVTGLSWDEGSELAIGLQSGEIKLWQQGAAAIRSSAKLPTSIASLAMASGGGRIVVGSASGILSVLDSRLNSTGQLRMAKLELAPATQAAVDLPVRDAAAGVTGAWDVRANLLALRLDGGSSHDLRGSALAELFPGKAGGFSSSPFRVKVDGNRVNVYANTWKQAIPAAKAAAPKLPALTNQQCRDYLGITPCPPLVWP